MAVEGFMSLSAAHESKSNRKQCQSCQSRKARFAYRGRVRADRDHTLCFECFRSERERRRAAAVARDPSRPSLLAAAAALSEREVAHRQAMLAHLRSLERGCPG